MKRKKDTPQRVARRNYEINHADERKKYNKVWATSVPRTFADELDAYLAKHDISKVAFLYLSFDLIKKEMEEKKN